LHLRALRALSLPAGGESEERSPRLVGLAPPLAGERRVGRGRDANENGALRRRFRSSASPRGPHWPARCASRAALNGLPSYQLGHVLPAASSWPTACSSSRSSAMPSKRQPSWTSSLGWW